MRKHPFLVNDNVVHLGPLRESHEKCLRNLEEIIEVQLRDGNWNYNEYMMGLTNGLLLAQSIMIEAEPDFLSKPDVWGEDKIADCESHQPERIS